MTASRPPEQLNSHFSYSLELPEVPAPGVKGHRRLGLLAVTAGMWWRARCGAADVGAMASATVRPGMRAARLSWIFAVEEPRAR